MLDNSEPPFRNSINPKTSFFPNAMHPMSLEIAIHQCLIHESEVLFTFTNLKKHYLNYLKKLHSDRLLTQCPIQDCATKIERMPRYVMYHLLHKHHKVPFCCPLKNCPKMNNVLKYLNHSLEEFHPGCISMSGVFVCPACKEEICTQTDFILIFQHFGNSLQPECAGHEPKNIIDLNKGHNESSELWNFDLDSFDLDNNELELPALNDNENDLNIKLDCSGFPRLDGDFEAFE